MGAKLGQQLPHVWKIGNNTRTHDQWVVYGQQRNQAKWRNEEWLLDFEDWSKYWDPKWDTGRGRSGESYCLVRKDYRTPWTKDNIELLTRRQHTSKQHGKLQKVRESEAVA